MDPADDLRRQFGKELLGPLFAEFARRLHLYFAATPQPAVALYCARGGLRLHAIYARWLHRVGRTAALPEADFPISRLLAAKVSLLAASEETFACLMYEFRRQSVRQVAIAFLPEAQREAVRRELCDRRFDAVAGVAGMRWLFFGDHNVAEQLRAHAEEQAGLFAGYMSPWCSPPNRILLVDSGLYGRTQRLLAAAMPQLEWHGAYFARSNYAREATPHFDRTIGLILEHDEFSHLIAESALLRDWHLIEAVLEANIPSVKFLLRRADGGIGSNLDATAWQSAVENDGNPYFVGVLDYLDSLGQEDFHRSRGQFRRTMTRLQRAILYPSQADLVLMEVGNRNRDFGLPGGNPVLRHQVLPTWRGVHRRIREALWLEGQVALELAPFGTPLLCLRHWLGRAMAMLRFLSRRP